MIRYEIRKLLQRMPARILLIVLFAANAFLVWNLHLPGTEPYLDYDAAHMLSLYAALPEHIEQALALLEYQNDVLLNSIIWGTDSESLLTGDAYAERRLFSNLIERLEPIVEYDSMLREIDENSEILLLSGQYVQGSFPGFVQSTTLVVVMIDRSAGFFTVQRRCGTLIQKKSVFRVVFDTESTNRTPIVKAKGGRPL